MDEKKTENNPIPWRAVVIGAVLSVFVGLYSMYAGLKIGGVYWPIVTTSLVSMALLKILGSTDRNEINVMQTAANTGGLLAAGLIFTIPAAWMLGFDISTWDLFWICIIGGGIGLVFSVPLRQQLIVKEKLPYADGAAAAALIEAGDKGGRQTRTLGIAVAVGGVVAAARDYFAWIPGFVNLDTLKISAGKVFSLGSSVSLIPFAGGYLIGPRFTLAWFLGAIATYFMIVPYLLANGAPDKAGVLINVAKPLGVGIVFGSAIAYFLLKGVGTLGHILADWKGASGGKTIGLAVIVATGILTIIADFNLPLALIAMVGAFAMAFVAARVTGEMNVDPLEIFAFLVMLCAKALFGFNAVYLVVIAAVVAIAAGTAGDVMQDLKAGHLLGTNPKHQLIAQAAGMFSAALVLGTALFALQASHGIGTPEFPAPQATALSEILSAQGIPSMMLVGMVAGLILTALTNAFGWGIASVAFGIGLYVPIELSFPLFVGGMLRYLAEKAKKADFWRLAAAGAIAGEGLIGVLLALAGFFGA